MFYIPEALPIRSEQVSPHKSLLDFLRIEGLRRGRDCLEESYRFEMVLYDLRTLCCVVQGGMKISQRPLLIEGRKMAEKKNVFVGCSCGLEEPKIIDKNLALPYPK